MNDDTLGFGAWNELKRRRRRFYLLWLGWPSGGGAIFLFFTLFVQSLRHLGLPVPEEVVAVFGFVLFVVWGYFWQVAGRQVGGFPCLRCHQAIGTSFTSFWKVRCPHCALREP